ncbi:MAG: hypothetical protein E7453_03435 [Ruminococcaceae bacterium]|nr:hypothetical protein [Oscillospiraceae bacterium]
MHKIILSDGAVLSSGAEGAAIKRVTVTKSVCTAGELTVGTVCAAVAEIEIMDTAGVCPIGAGEEFSLYREDTLLGVFTVETPKRLSATQFQLTAYDPVARLDRNLDDWLQGLTGWPYPLRDFAGMVCGECGNTLETESLPDTALSVPAIVGSGITGRRLLSWMGEAMGCFLRAKPAGELEFSWYTPSNTEIGTDDVPIFGGTLQYEDYETAGIDCVVIRKTQTDVGISYPEKGGNPYIIEGNPILTGGEGDREIARQLYARLRDLSYCPFSAEIPVGTAQPGQYVTVHTPEGKTFSSLLMTVEGKNGREKIGSTGSRNRSSVTAQTDFRLGALSGRIMTLQTDLDGIRAENRDGEGKAAALQLSVDSLRAEISRQAGVTEGLKTSVTQMVQTADSLKLDIRSVKENGTEKVTTSTGYTFDETGLHIRKDGQEMENRLDHTGMYVHRSGETILRADASGVLATDVQVRNYLNVGEHARFQDYDGGTGCFYL